MPSSPALIRVGPGACFEVMSWIAVLMIGGMLAAPPLSTFFVPAA